MTTLLFGTWHWDVSRWRWAAGYRPGTDRFLLVSAAVLVLLALVWFSEFAARYEIETWSLRVLLGGMFVWCLVGCVQEMTMAERSEGAAVIFAVFQGLPAAAALVLSEVWTQRMKASAIASHSPYTGSAA